jgi:hypothetical protein
MRLKDAFWYVMFKTVLRPLVILAPLVVLAAEGINKFIADNEAVFDALANNTCPVKGCDSDCTNCTGLKTVWDNCIHFRIPEHRNRRDEE